MLLIDITERQFAMLARAILKTVPDSEEDAKDLFDLIERINQRSPVPVKPADLEALKVLSDDDATDGHRALHKILLALGVKERCDEPSNRVGLRNSIGS